MTISPKKKVPILTMLPIFFDVFCHSRYETSDITNLQYHKSLADTNFVSHILNLDTNVPEAVVSSVVQDQILNVCREYPS